MTFYRNNINRQPLYCDDEENEESFELPNIASRRPLPSTNRITANVSNTQYDVVLDVCENLLRWKLQFEAQTRSWDIMWTDHAVSSEMLQRMEQHQKINHFPGMSNLSRKNLLARNLQKMQEQFPQDYTFFPRTWMLPYDLHKLRNYTAEMRRKNITKTFIVKPEASSQGRGIYLTKSLNDIPQHEHCVVQKYLTNPLLFEGLKFDLRVYVLVAGCDPLRLYIYNQGLVRLATEPYTKPSPENMDNMYVHLTNYAINKDNPNFVFNESEQDLNHGHKRSLAEFFQTLKKRGFNSARIWASVKDIICKTMISGQPFLSHEYRMCQPHNLQNDMCFEILGFDIMIDSEERAWLLEINYTPSFSCESPLDQLIKSNLIRDSLLLMNVTTQNRDSVIRRVKQQQQTRVFTGKTLKYDREERAKLVAQLQIVRDDYQNEHMGSYERIYPPISSDLHKKYLKFLEYSEQSFSSSTRHSRKAAVSHSQSHGGPKKKEYRKSTVVSTEPEAKQFEGEKPGMNTPNIFIQPNISPTKCYLPKMSDLPKVPDRNSSISSDIFSIVDALDRSRIQEKNKPGARQFASIGGHLISLPSRNSATRPPASLFEQSCVEEQSTMFSRRRR